LNFLFVELPKFRKTIEELKTNADRWWFCLRNLANLNNQPTAVQGKIFERLFKAAEIKQLTNKEMETYSKSVLEYADVRSAVDFAFDNGIEKGFGQGMEKGIKQGIKQGIELGIERGILSRNRAIAQNLLNLHIPILDIAKATGLTPEQILELP
jgi:predicted transposase/invertase (TIGR01784 family)